MTTSSQGVERVTPQESQGGAPVAAAALMLTSAILTFFVGIFALTANLVFSGPGYEYTFRISGWGWVNLVTALVVAAVAIGLLVNAAATWVAAVVVACLAMVVSFLWMPYYPAGSIVLIALDLAVIWGVATWGASRGPA